MVMLNIANSYLANNKEQVMLLEQTGLKNFRGVMANVLNCVLEVSESERSLSG